MADVHAQAVLVSVIIRTPDSLAEGIVGNDVPPVFGQLAQERTLGGRQGKGPAIRQNDKGIVQIHRAAAQQKRRVPGRRKPGAVDPLQDVLHPQKEFLHQEGLGQVIVRAQPQPEQPVGICIPGREKQRRDIRLCPQGTEQGKPVAVRQVDVQDHQFRAVRFKRRPGRSAVRCGGNVNIARSAELLPQELQQIRVVVHDQQFCIVQCIHGSASFHRIGLSSGSTIPYFFRTDRHSRKI